MSAPKAARKAAGKPRRDHRARCAHPDNDRERTDTRLQPRGGGGDEDVPDNLLRLAGLEDGGDVDGEAPGEGVRGYGGHGAGGPADLGGGGWISVVAVREGGRTGGLDGQRVFFGNINCLPRLDLCVADAGDLEPGARLYDLDAG